MFNCLICSIGYAPPHSMVITLHIYQVLQTMKYFKALVAFTELKNGEAQLNDHILYCCSERSPHDSEIQDLFNYTWQYSNARKFISCIWVEVSKDEIPAGQIHAYLS